MVSLTELVRETGKKIKSVDISLEGSGENLDVIVSTVNHHNVEGFILQVAYYRYRKGTLSKPNRLYLGRNGNFLCTGSGIGDSRGYIQNSWLYHINYHNIMNFKAWDRLKQKCFGDL